MKESELLEIRLKIKQRELEIANLKLYEKEKELEALYVSPHARTLEDADKEIEQVQKDFADMVRFKDEKITELKRQLAVCTRFKDEFFARAERAESQLVDARERQEEIRKELTAEIHFSRLNNSSACNC